MSKLRLHRFMSNAEFFGYMRGDALRNDTNHFREGYKTTSIGFCFFTGNKQEWAHRLNGLVDFDVLLTVEVDAKDVNQSIGVYPDYSSDLIFPPSKSYTEYCTTAYSRDVFRFVSVDRHFVNVRNFISKKYIESVIKTRKPNAIN